MADGAWGPLAEPVHPQAAGPDDPVWKDNAYMAFWDLDRAVVGTVHVSTSPNEARGRRARCSLSIGGRTVEVIETLEAGTLSSSSIHVDLTGRVRVDHPDIQLDLQMTPHLTAVDYSDLSVIPKLVEGQPLQHHQYAMRATGTATLADGTIQDFDAFGIRDRTWGFRDEAAQWVEYAAFLAVLETKVVSAMKFLAPDGSTAVEGFVIEQDRISPVADLRLRRNAAALLLRATVEHTDGTITELDVTSRAGGFWVPMGADTDGPAFGTYDQFVALTDGSADGGALIEQGILHRVH